MTYESKNISSQKGGAQKWRELVLIWPPERAQIFARIHQNWYREKVIAYPLSHYHQLFYYLSIHIISAEKFQCSLPECKPFEGMELTYHVTL